MGLWRGCGGAHCGRCSAIMGSLHLSSFASITYQKTIATFLITSACSLGRRGTFIFMHTFSPYLSFSVTEMRGAGGTYVMLLWKLEPFH